MPPALRRVEEASTLLLEVDHLILDVVVVVVVVVVVGCFEVFVLLGLVDGLEVVGLGVGGIDEVEVNVTKRQAAIPRTPRSKRAREVRRRIWIRLNLRLRL